ncbi:MAG: HAMP domain-containing protein [Nitrospinae bacterium]|nr:HAMP domain-containing protein [Nitrospinota bacterium]
MIRLRFKSFQSRILLFFLVLFSLILSATYILVGLANLSNAHSIIEADLKSASKIFLRLMDVRTGQLADSARILSEDYAFKAAFATGDLPTIGSALANQRGRIGADMIKLVSSEKKLIVGTDAADVSGSAFGYPGLIEMAADQGEAYALLVIGEETYQTVVVPLLAPAPVAWIVIGFKINDAVAKDFKKLTNMEVSFFQEEAGGKVGCFASTIPMRQRRPLLGLFQTGWKERKGDASELRVMGDSYISLTTQIGKTPGGEAAYAVLQRSLTRMMEPFVNLKKNLIAIGLAGLAISALAGIVVSRSVTKPITSLVEGVGRVEKGDYSTLVRVEQGDEMGTLATAINKMTVELAEKDKIRDLLGKVVSHEVAEELLGKDVELGGELREITVMFVDIRGFSARAEGLNPKEVLSFLNVVFTTLGTIIEEKGGVVDKYIGDAIMALFGAPVKHDDDADYALIAAIKIQEAVGSINLDLESRGMARMEVGVGINTGVTVVGNMGSMHRMNYTAIGDGVNLAARLQELTRRAIFDAKIVVSERTISKAKGNYLTRDLGMVNIRGRTEPVRLYALIGKSDPENPSNPKTL